MLGKISSYWFFPRHCWDAWRRKANFPTGLHVFTPTCPWRLTPSPCPTSIELVTPLSVPITVCLPEVCRWGFCGHPFFWAQVYYGLSPGRVSSTPCTHTHTRTHTYTAHAQHSWGHSLSTLGARLLPPQPDKSPRHTNTHTHKATGPLHERGHFFHLSTVTSNVSELLLLYSHWIWTKRRKEEEEMEKRSNMERWEKRKMGGRKEHLSPFIWETMINGLAFSWSVLPQCFLWASSDKRVFEGKWTLQILLFVWDGVETTTQCFNFNQGKPSERVCFWTRVTFFFFFCISVIRVDARQGHRGGRSLSLRGVKKSQHSTLHWHVSPLLVKDIQRFALGVRG